MIIAIVLLAYLGAVINKTVLEVYREKGQEGVQGNYSVKTALGISGMIEGQNSDKAQEQASIRLKLHIWIIEEILSRAEVEMTSYLLPIIIAIVAVILVFKFVKSIIKGIIILVVLALALLAYNQFSDGITSFNSQITLPTIVKQQTPEQKQELSKMVEKLKGLNSEEVEKVLQKSQAELAKYGLTADNVKNALKELKP